MEKPSTPGEQERNLRDLQFLADVAREALSSLRLNPLLWRTAQLLRQRFGYDFAAIGLVEEGYVVFRAASGAGIERDGSHAGELWRVPLGNGIAGKAAAQHRCCLTNDVQADPDFENAGPENDTRSELAAPITSGEEVIGVINLQSRRKAAFGDPDLRLLELIAAVVAPAVVTAQAFETERRRTRYLRLVTEISKLVSSSLHREEVLSLACGAMLDALDTSFVGIVLLDPTGTRVVHGGHASRVPFVDGFDMGKLSMELGEGIASKAITSGEIVRVGDVREHPLYREVVKGMRAELCVPLRLMGRVIGAIDVEHDKPNHFTDDDEYLLDNLSGILAQAIDNARLFDTLRRRWHQLLLINEVARVSTTSIELQQILDMVAHQIRDRFGYFGVVLMLCEDRDIVVAALACESEPQLSIGYREPIGRGIAGSAAQKGHTLQVDDPAEFGGTKVLGPRVQSILCVPLVHGERVIGAIQAQSFTRFDEDDLLVLETLAKSVTGWIANARAINQTEQLREDLNRMIVHDLRNPVQAVLYTLQEVSGLELPEPKEEAVQNAIQSTSDILEMVNSLLDVARFEAGRIALRKEVGSLNDHVRTVVRQIGPVARAKGIQVTTVLSQDVPVACFDHDLIRRMLHNLIGNALKFTEPGGPVTIRTEFVTLGEPAAGAVSPPYILLSVADRGEGIPVEYQDKIFEKFGQVESRKAGLKMSTGLGLALCRYVVEGHEGHIWVKSAPSEGSTFFVALPTGR